MVSNRVVPILDAGGPSLASDLRVTLEKLVTLGDVMKWGLAQTPPRSPVEIVTQDEYTHDVLLEWQADCYLVFDTT